MAEAVSGTAERHDALTPSRAGSGPGALRLSGPRPVSAPGRVRQGTVLRLGRPADGLQPGRSTGWRAATAAVVLPSATGSPGRDVSGSHGRSGARRGGRRDRGRRRKGRGHRCRRGRYVRHDEAPPVHGRGAADATAAMATAAGLHGPAAERARPGAQQLRPRLLRLHDGPRLHGELMDIERSRHALKWSLIMKAVVSAGLVLVVLVMSLPRTSVGAAGKFDGSTPVICGTTAVTECGADGRCLRGTATDVNFPAIFQVDAAG